MAIFGLNIFKYQELVAQYRRWIQLSRLKLSPHVVTPGKYQIDTRRKLHFHSADGVARRRPTNPKRLPLVASSLKRDTFGIRQLHQQLSISLPLTCTQKSISIDTDSVGDLHY